MSASKPSLSDRDLDQYETWAREDLIGEKRGSLAQQAAARRTLELIAELRERRKRDAIPALIRWALEEMARLNRLPKLIPLRYAVEYSLTDDGSVYVRSEEGGPARHTSGEILQQLYDSELHFDIRARWQAGFDWALLSHEDLADAASGTEESFEDAARALGEAAVRAHPGGAFATWWTAL